MLRVSAEASSRCLWTRSDLTCLALPPSSPRRFGRSLLFGRLWMCPHAPRLGRSLLALPLDALSSACLALATFGSPPFRPKPLLWSPAGVPSCLRVWPKPRPVAFGRARTWLPPLCMPPVPAVLAEASSLVAFGALRFGVPHRCCPWGLKQLRANTPLPTVPVNDFSSLTERVSRRSETVSATSTLRISSLWLAPLPGQGFGS
jgi:hypothetical protein